MDLNEYQKIAMETCTESSKNFSYMMLNLISEIGELIENLKENNSYFENDFDSILHTQIFISKKSGSIAKEIRKGCYPFFADLKTNQKTLLELGDILWQFAGLCKIVGVDMETVATMNIEKLRSRKQQNKIVDHE